MVTDLCHRPGSVFQHRVWPASKVSSVMTSRRQSRLSPDNLRTRRVVFGSREAEPTKHLGEAMTLVLIETREELRGSWWVTDDREAAEHADRKGITTRDTMHIMGELVSEGTLTAVDAFALMQTMRDRDRHMRMPGSPRDLQ